ncbi:MAG: DUF4198 domain-containing protein [Desulfobacterales bacterium]
MKKRNLVWILGALALLFIANPAAAHNLWLNPGNHYPEAGETVDIGIGWGHQYPADRTDQEVKEDTVKQITAFDPDGEIVELERKSASLYQLKVQKPGVYLVTAGIKTGVFTTTPEGRKWANKKEVEHPLKCTSYNIIAKTLIVVGGNDKNLSGTAGQPLEVILLENPSKLKKGDRLPVRVLFEGKPMSGIELKAKYAGFDDSSNDGHGHGGDKKYPAETVTDEQGDAFIELKEEGSWMISLSHRTPYPDAETCDEYMYNSAFTFEIK